MSGEFSFISMNFEQQNVMQRLAAIQGQQTHAECVQPVADLDSLFQEAQELIAAIRSYPDHVSLEQLEDFWAESMMTLGPEWEDLLCEVLDSAEESEAAGEPFHRNGHMYWGVLELCYRKLQDDDVDFCRELFHGCLSCLRAARTLQESELREQAERLGLADIEQI